MVHHGEYLRVITKDDHLIYHLERDWTKADLPPDERAMLEYARKLNFEPSRMTGQDFQSLRDAGFDDRGALDIVMIVSVFNLLNRWANAVGVAPEVGLARAKERGDARAEADLKPQAAAGG